VKIELKESGCANPYHPPECERLYPECIRDLEGHVVLTEEEWLDVCQRNIRTVFREVEVVKKC
jgi:hypothetical protein